MEITKQATNHYKLKSKKGYLEAKLGESVVIATSLNKQGFAIAEPGEYEVEGISVFASRGADKLISLVQMDDVKILLVSTKIEESFSEELDVVDVLVIDIDQLDPKEVVATITQIEPSYVIVDGDPGKVALFIKDYEHASRELDKLSLNKGSIVSDVTEVIVLK